MTSSTRSMTRGLCLALSLSLATPTFAAAVEPAKVAFQRAQRAYDLGQFEEALKGYSEVYRLKSHPALLFNIAQCHRQLAQYERAAFFYRRYLSLSPKAPNFGTAEDLAQEMEQKHQSEVRRKQLEEQAAQQRELNLRIAEAKARAEAEARAGSSETQVNAARALAPAPGVAVRGGSKPITQRWWFWTGVAVVAAGAATAVYLSTAPSPSATTLADIDARR
ncbi:MAG TPA: tetratricopeptide repeat protein [Myxococcaceae bacterium]|nr:tetratricopeptide repeat protein [Myxococcaceae bacterium]